MKKGGFLLAALVCLLGAMPALASITKDGEKQFLENLKKSIPQDHIVSIDALHAKWEEVQTGKSKAVIVDIRTHDEFDAGHILGSNNIDSGHAYTLPEKFEDPNTEIWILCRTKHRASYFVGELYSYGYKNVYLTDGGIVGWVEKGYPLVNEYLGDIQVTKYNKKLKEEFQVREGH